MPFELPCDGMRTHLQRFDRLHSIEQSLVGLGILNNELRPTVDREDEQVPDLVLAGGGHRVRK